ncbi:MAG: glycosyltransferase family 2 protein [Acidimicrobiia bacterium]|nr:glycosyltransferase family 2 protein [Acidimicrobiia bacterium]
MIDRPAAPGGLSILLPAYNLEAVIASSIERVAGLAGALGEIEIVVCDDGSEDGTLAEAKAAAERTGHAQVIHHEHNRGKGAALTTAFEASTMPTVAFLDADLDLPPEQLPDLLDQFRDSGADVLVGLKQAAMEPGHYPGYRRVLSKAFSGAIRVLFRLPVEETQTGLKLFTREALESVLPKLSVERYAFDLELVVALRRAGFDIIGAPVVLAEGASSRGVSARTLWEMGRDTVRVWLRALAGRI